MNSYKQRMISLIKADIITLNGPKNSMKSMLVFLLVFSIALGFGFSPVGGLFGPLLVGAFFVIGLFSNEMKQNSRQMFSVIPIERKDLVRSRFILCSVLYTAVSITIYLLMLLSMQLKLWRYVTPSDEDVLEMISNVVDRMTSFGIFNLTFFIAYAIGLKVMAFELRAYLVNPQKYRKYYIKGDYRLKSKKEILTISVFLIVYILFILLAVGVIKVSGALAMILFLVYQLAQAANGILMGVILIIEALFFLIYCYISTVLKYDETDI